MAARSAANVVYVKDLTDPDEVRPKDEQAIVFEIEKDVPVRAYIEELNKHINDPKSFLYASRISGNRMCVVLATATQAKKLVEEVGAIKINGKTSNIKFFIEKSVKIIISNAGYGISNSALKRYLTKFRQITTLSSVSEFRTNMGQENRDTYDIRSFRRFVYILPRDVNKLPTEPIIFATDQAIHNVFFEVDSPKCFLCKNTGHFQVNCPMLGDEVNNKQATRETNDVDHVKTAENFTTSQKIAESINFSEAKFTDVQMIPEAETPNNVTNTKDSETHPIEVTSGVNTVPVGPTKNFSYVEALNFNSKRNHPPPTVPNLTMILTSWTLKMS